MATRKLEGNSVTYLAQYFLIPEEPQAESEASVLVLYGNSVTPFLFILESWLGPGSNLTLIYLFLVWSERFHLIVEYMNLEVCFLLLAFYFMYVFF